MTIAIGKYKDVSFYSSFNYMRLVGSGSFSSSGTGDHTIALPAGTGTPFVEVYGTDAGGIIYPITGQYLTAANFYIDGAGTNLIIHTAGTFITQVYYFIYRSNQ